LTDTDPLTDPFLDNTVFDEAEAEEG